MTDGSNPLRIYNTLTRTKEVFDPIDADHVRMYVCGPTVYDYAHIGNARPAIVFDVLYRLLRHLYGEDRVTYVRNITDVDDKINARALRDYGAEIEVGRLSLNEAIRKVTEPTYDQYQKDVAALGCLPPTHQPRATEYVLPRADGRADMVSLIQSLIDRGHAYAAKGEILFDTASMPDYGQLSKRNLDEQQAGARVAVDAHKKNPGDFVLWKESSDAEPGWDATFTVDGKPLAIRGRPGWHIECSAMSDALLWDELKNRLSAEAQALPHRFDIHGGGLDLIFPHHENEIAQSRCGHGTAAMANYWMHNGFLQVEGRKMSKSEGNFVTIHELLETEKFGGRKWPGEVLRLAMLMTNYKEPIDFSADRLRTVSQKLDELSDLIVEMDRQSRPLETFPYRGPSEDLIFMLTDDLRTDGLEGHIERLTQQIRGKFGGFWSARAVIQLADDLDFLGFDLRNWRERQVESRVSQQVVAGISEKIDERLAFIREKNWAEADRIRDELLEQGIQLKDGKDPETGDRITTWEVKR
ncbi:MAG: cysteine--tRNA ligase [Rhizobiaceae bacterium]|nr:cysteine--tRNA ligase [Rhizobiaceae bacterium]